MITKFILLKVLSLRVAHALSWPATSLDQLFDNNTVTCLWQPTQADKQQQCQFILALASNNQEIENQYIANAPLYTRVLQYLNYDIAQDVYLRLPHQPDSVAASTASYPRQYGNTGRSSVLLVFPVAEKQLRHGCFITFKGEKLELGTRRFTFTAHDIKAARQRQRAAQ